ncbi:hypothetical protein F2Q69_00011835 [Brassica cretica]|uniref:Uncharacterized protein n=1 Tax=Brassica cretica TaxID=69181 RepID=A0A8S9R5Z9_BRACR|nr:hypothetical protein F2Q69_00011835 [Brassica cretica]
MVAVKTPRLDGVLLVMVVLRELRSCQTKELVFLPLLESSKQGVGVTPSPGNSEAVIVSKEVTEPDMEEGEFRPSDGVEAVSQRGNRSAPAGSANMDPTVGIPTEELSAETG